MGLGAHWPICQNSSIENMLDILIGIVNPDLQRDILAADLRPGSDDSAEHVTDLLDRQSANPRLGVCDDKNFIGPDLKSRCIKAVRFPNTYGDIRSEGLGQTHNEG